MSLRDLFEDLAESSTLTKLAIAAVVLIWGIVIVALVAGGYLLLEATGQAQRPDVIPGTATITLEPAQGPVGTTVNVQGEGWQAGGMALIYLTTPDAPEATTFAVAGAVADSNGRFTLAFVIPQDARWQPQGTVLVVARDDSSGTAAQATFTVLPTGTPGDQTPPAPGETPTSPPDSPIPPTGEEATATPATPGQPPQPEIEPGKPSLTATTDLNVRAGPGTNYPVLGLLRAGQSAEITGISANGAWFQIRFAPAADGRGWVAAAYVTTRNAANLPLVAAPATPTPTQAPPTDTPTATPQPTATPTPIVITEWRGEYFNNPNLSGDPALVRNDYAISFDWGTGAPAAGLPADNFSVRWTRTLHFPAGTYRFFTRTDDGVRLWINNQLIIDQWRDTSAVTHSADITLTEGNHSLRMEYYERTGSALAHLWWERIDSYPEWKAEYFDNRKLKGNPVLVRNESTIAHNWGTGSPAPGVPADNFSARWTRKLDFKEGTHRFRLRVDDGARFWINDQLIIDEWRDGSRQVQVEHFLPKGKHTLRLEYYERTGYALIELDWQRLEQPANKPPQANPGGPYSVDEGAPITFDGRASSDPDGSIVKYEWDFNYNGVTFVPHAQGATVTATFPDGPASVAIALRVTDNKGATHIATTTVTVRNVPPTVQAGGPYSGTAGSPITMIGSASDPSPIDQLGLLYSWEFGNGAKGFGPVVSHSYSQSGTYTVKLTVIDKAGGKGTATTTAQVSATNQPPSAKISGPSSGLVGEALSFSGSKSSDPDGVIVSYLWDMGDGSQKGGPNASHSYTQPGTYTITLTVIDNGGLSASASHTIQVTVPANQPPSAKISGPSSGLVGEALSFSGSKSSDPDGAIVSYAWNFGDNSTASGLSVNHSYTQPGVYTVSLTVTDNGGLSDTATLAVTITAPPPNQPPSAKISLPAEPLRATDVIVFDGSQSTDSDGEIVTYAWSLGDGTTASGVSVTHTYTLPGYYIVRLTVTDDADAEGQASETIHILPAEDAVIGADPGGIYTGTVGLPLTFTGVNSYPADDIVSYEWDFNYDGETFTSTASGSVVTYTYSLAGSYTVGLRVTDSENNTSLAVTTATISQNGSATSTRPSRGGTSIFDMLVVNTMRRLVR